LKTQSFKSVETIEGVLGGNSQGPFFHLRRKEVTLEEIKAIPILDVAHWLGLNIKGRSAHCFSHLPDRHPSLVFNIQRNTFKCFVCPMVHGSVIDLVMQVRGVDFIEAVEQLCHYNGEAVPWRSDAVPSKPKRQTTSLSPEYKSMILKSLLQVAPLEQEGCRYLIERGIAPETARTLGVGFLRPETYESLIKSWSRFTAEPRFAARA